MRNEQSDGTIPFERSAAQPPSLRGFRLEVLEGPARGTTWESQAGNCTIGVHPSCELRLADETVSRFHCEIAMAENGARVRDLGSLNGLIVDGVRVIDAFLKSGSMLHLGSTVLRFQYAGRYLPLQLSERSSFGELVGVSTSMRSLFAVLERAASTEATILLEGETGTGKSATARAVHEHSARSAAPLVMIDCGALPATLLDSELFGHEKGAFTGADSKRVGAFEEATGGTIFLDEIGELHLSLQPKLLGAIENRAIRRLGSNVQRPVDVRVIAATHRDLRAEVNAGRFREDLYYRLAVVTIRVPSLRQRLEDMSLLVEKLLARLGASPERIRDIMTTELMASLRNSAWPGNIRELRNYLEQYLIFEGMLPARFDYPETSPLDIDIQRPFPEARQQILDAFERRYITELLRAHKGKIAQAAAAAGVNRTYLYRLMHRHGIER